VQRGAFGACLMSEPQLVADCVKAMRDAVTLPVTVKHRTGVDRTESYGFVRDFVGTVAQAGCEVFIVHARNAWLKGISPKENRELPPLRYEMVHQLKREFPALTIVLNGGVKTNEQIEQQLEFVDGVMLGREAYHQPWLMADWDARFFRQPAAGHDRDAIEDAMVVYMQGMVARGEPWSHVSRHLLGLRNGLAGARHWRQVWSDHRRKLETPAVVSRAAREGAAVFA
jgi:tRNA-dihydrouridine synthase A